MLEWAQITESFVIGQSRQSLDENRILQLALARALQIIGEAANNITDESKRNNARIPWVDIIGMRHRLVHVYYAIDLDVIWRTTTEYIPPLIKDLERLLELDDMS